MLQCARFYRTANPLHKGAVHKTFRYLKATKNKALIFKPEEKRVVYYVDANFADNWKLFEEENPPI